MQKSKAEVPKWEEKRLILWKGGLDVKPRRSSGGIAVWNQENINGRVCFLCWNGQECLQDGKHDAFTKTISVESAGNGFDWGASIVIAVICVISRAAVQMSVFTHNEAKPALCEPTLIYSSQK